MGAPRAALVCLQRAITAIEVRALTYQARVRMQPTYVAGCRGSATTTLWGLRMGAGHK